MGQFCGFIDTRCTLALIKSVQDGGTALMTASAHGHLEIGRMLILAGADVSAGDVSVSTKSVILYRVVDLRGQCTVTTQQLYIV
jgi:hypothetical protein